VLRERGSGRRGGVAGERLAELHYRLRGYRVLGRNVWAGGHELDLILRRGRTVVFCEVKRKRGHGHGDPLEMVGPEKLRRIRRAAEAWLAAHPDAAALDLRFEVAAVRGRRVSRVVA
jgi:putative endonuclease